MRRLAGFCFGLGYFLAGVSWVYVSLHDFGAMPALLAGIMTLLFCVILALYPAITGWLYHALGARSTLVALAALPALWTLTEWLRGWLFTGFPWLALGYSQVPDSPLAGYVPVLGVYGVDIAHAAQRAAMAVQFVPRDTACAALVPGRRRWSRSGPAVTRCSRSTGRIPRANRSA